MIRGVLILAMLMFAGPALAQEAVAYEAEGDAPSHASDPRVAALDDAFSKAAASAVGDLVTGDVRTAHKGEIDREIVGHARLWVVKFTVTKDETNDDRRQLTVSVRVDRDKMRTRLGELGIATREIAGSDATGAAPLQTVTILLRVASPEGVHADYGQTADKDVPGLGSLTNVFRTAGMAVRRAPAAGPAARAQGELPLDDDEAEALAVEAKAELVAIAGVTVAAPVAVRGLAAPAVLVTAHVKLYAKKDKRTLGSGVAISAARSDDPGLVTYAIERAVLAASADMLPPVPKKLSQAGAFHGDDAPITEPGVVLVRLPAKTSFHMVQDELKYLAGAKGIRAASLRRLSPNGWVIGLQTSESIERVAQIAKKPPATDTSAAVKVVGDVVELALSGSP
ncbi:MAG: hypothetical protein JWO36_362 [Myxococcales bacterium]|nr:hypothetical protein [Myxococcales bacterium]